MTLPAPRPHAATEAEQSRYVAERLLDAARADLSRADTKASVLLSGGLTLPVLVGTRGMSSAAGGQLALWAVAGAAWLAGIGLLICAVLPFSGTRRAQRTGQVTYYGDALRDATVEGLARLVEQAGRAPVEWLLTQFHDVSTILARKYTFIRGGLWALVAALGLAALAALRG
ncbi:MULTISPECIES: Pycsar system effector family protein [unclassified Streptomyces]|uniref:Pycsar system effector family protein n=1 Tax=unclassified Streptomyces TaxID=2593676 RepID=UPI000DBA9D40|nr:MULTISPECIES: Pycsar system effector family protein [unclassified Streptomyces]MYT68422.1 hypothetical protein [Streptomyces sp. SID8367]RAJ86095.1 hypothetical protein K377_02937 [Streptomyces sp. PsTaAH-137]